MVGIDGKWICTLNTDYWHDDCMFDHKHEAIKAVRLAHASDDKILEADLFDVETTDLSDTDETFFVGQIKSIKPVIDAEIIMEQIQDFTEQRYGNDRDEFEYYVGDIDKGSAQELEGLVNNWLIKHDYMPNSFEIVNVDPVRFEVGKRRVK